MLGSITPLGERGRGMRWGVTVAWLGAGAAIGGSLAATALGVLGRLGHAGALSSAGRQWIIVALTLGAVALDASRRIPTLHRQVNDSWMHAYRGWAYGFGFGIQLGTGAATVVTTGGTYAAFLVAGLVGGLKAAVIGATFGLARAGPLLAARSVTALPGLVELERQLRGMEEAARWIAVGAYVALGVGLLMHVAL